MIANLGMYAFAEVANTNEMLWQAIAKNLNNAGIPAPARLTSVEEDKQIWLSPELVFSQTCGLPLRSFLRANVTLIGTPDYGLNGCEKGYYYSVMIARKSDKRNQATDFDNAPWCANAVLSQSGYAAALELAQRDQMQLAEPFFVGSHENSARTVQLGKADFALIDAITWRLLVRAGKCDDLKVISKSPHRPGLPFITRLGEDKDQYFNATRDAILKIGPENPLGIRDLIDIPLADYLVIPIPSKTSESLDL